MLPLDHEEQAILDAVENDEWNSVPLMLQEIQRYQRYAQAHLAELEEVKIEISAGDLISLQNLAAQSGVSVSLLVASVIHEYIANQASAQS